ncbi:hypothetical protein ACLOAV_003781 [Pseudogymnoascus australis]
MEEEENFNIRAVQIAKGNGKSSGNLNQIHQSIEEAVEAAKAKSELDGWRSVNKATTGSLATIGKGFGRGLRLVSRVEETIMKNTENATKVVDGIIETTNGFYDVKSNSPKQESSKNWPRTYISHHDTDYKNYEEPAHSRIPYSFSAITENGHKDSKHSWWKFWNGPSGSFPSPLPHGYEKIANSREKIPGASGLAQIAAQAKSKVRKGQRQKYPPHVDYNYKEDEAKALWSKYIKKSDRSTHRIPRFGICFLPYICPWINKKVDKIYWCREELARLNVEIEYDQDHFDNFPRANSAFIQFNQQIAAHMAVQVVSHHTPMYMAHRMVEVSPTDIIWDNMSIKWWESWLRTSIVFAMAACMCLLWAIPVSATALLGNIPELVKKYHWLGFLVGGKNTLAHVAGILPAIVLAILKDTGGLLYPRAINQTFVGLYFMEVCLIGLFLLVRDSENNAPCLPQALIMIVVMIMTALFQILLDRSFGPLYKHLPVTLEDDAILRDKAFERAHAARITEDDEFQSAAFPVSCDDSIELRKLHCPAANTSDPSPSSTIPNTAHGGAFSVVIRPCNPRTTTSGDPDKRGSGRCKDIEAQKTMTEALFSGHRDEIEDLKPTERNALINVAFQHEALRAMRPNVWLPHDDLGVSDQEVQRTEDFCKGNVWITNKGTALNSRLRVIYRTNPPDFTEVSLIKL